MQRCVFPGNIRVQSEPVYWGIIRHEGVVFYLSFVKAIFAIGKSRAISLNANDPEQQTQQLWIQQVAANP